MPAAELKPTPEPEPKPSPEPELKLLAFGSCRKQNQPAPIWASVTALRPDAWVWTGDAIYPRGNAAPAELHAAYLTAAADDDLVRSAVRVYDGVYDDHDFGLNDAGRTFPGRQAGRQAFLEEIVRAPAGSTRRTQRDGLYGARTFGSPPRQLKLIMLDTRYSRDDHYIYSVGGSSWLPKPGYLAAAVRLASAVLGVGSSYDGDVLGEEQWAWLSSELSNSSAAAHIIVSSIQVRRCPWVSTKDLEEPTAQEARPPTAQALRWCVRGCSARSAYMLNMRNEEHNTVFYSYLAL